MSIRTRPSRHQPAKDQHFNLCSVRYGKNIRRPRRYQDSETSWSSVGRHMADDDTIYEVNSPYRQPPRSARTSNHQTHASRAALSFQKDERGWVDLTAGEGGESNPPAFETSDIGLGLSEIQPRESSDMDDEPPSSGSRNNSLFFGSAVSSDLPRPPPSRAVRKETQLPPIITSTPHPEPGQTHGGQVDDLREIHHSSLASRLRNIVAANRKTVVKTLPIPEHLRSDATVSESTSPTSSNPSPTRNTTPSPSNSIDHKQRGHGYNATYSSSSFSDDESFLPLPSPATAMTPSVSTSQFSPTHHTTKYITQSVTPSPTDMEGIKADDPIREGDHETNIPILSASPSYAPRKRQEIPSVVDHPILGDSAYEENKPHSYVSKKSHLYDTTQAKYSASPLGNNREERMIGKTIWKFRIQKLLGVGAFSKVYLVECTETGKKYAIKMISKDRLALDSRIRSSIDREVAILEYIDHPNVVHLDCTMETEHHFCLVLEHVDGGELYDYVEKLHKNLTPGQTVDEMLIKRLFLQLVNVMIWLHEKHIVHRDLKLENILVSSASDSDVPVLKLSDFGLARVIEVKNPILRTRCGSEEYAAPEIIQNTGYDGRKTDTWALGVILYALLVGYLPFMYNPARGEKVSHLFYRILSSSQVKWPSEWTKDPSRSISQEAKDVVNRLLTRQPDKRIDLTEVKNMAWFNDCDLDVDMA
ncbi:hypothetical protein INT44_003264 [Umbelopsis vinacea]|uniref:Protein kinase domain-containing protein n=1 Tax=Umbelopsis vinacea TaxID=44442 RepID=A0A8H7Q945_9FUNG|nr:hypothetical protein INT44_003264 [Umbelopsis vinacea]